jgi:hypothetical protein
VAVIIDNIPMIYPLFRRIVQNVDDTLASHYAGRSRNKLSANSGSSGSYAMNERKEKKSKFIHPLSMRNATMSDSSESIVRADRVKNGTDILIVKESTVDVSPTTYSQEDIKHYPISQRAGTGYAATCNPTTRPADVPRSSRRGSIQLQWS